MTVHASALDAIEQPRLVRVLPNLALAAFPLMKLAAARAALGAARARGQLDPGTVVLETTSGTYGLALSLACAEIGQPLMLVCDDRVQDSLLHQMQDLGARVDIVEGDGDGGGSQIRRIRQLQILRTQHPRHYWPNQYDNAEHANSYAGIAQRLADSLPEVGTVIGATGSGASLCGIAKAIRTISGPQITAVDTHGSVLFGQADAPRVLQGIGNSLLPKNLDHNEIDWVHWVTAGEAFLATRLLHRRHQLFMGPTSGAVYMVAEHVARTDPNRVVVALLADEGHRYATTVYDDEWLFGEGLLLEELPQAPVQVVGPEDCPRVWSSMKWGRRPPRLTNG